MPSRLGLAWLGIVCGLGCSSGQDEAAQKSAAQVARAIELLRQAPNPAKTEPLANLAKLGCAAPDVCQTRDACTRAYTLHVDAVMLTAAAKQNLQDGKPTEAAKLLSASEQKLTDSSSQVTTCTTLEGALRRHYKL